MQVTLSPELEALVRAKVESGRYPSVDAFVNVSVHRHLDQDEVDEEFIAELRNSPRWQQIKEMARAGFEDIERGNFQDFDEAGLDRFFDNLIRGIPEATGSKS